MANYRSLMNLLYCDESNLEHHAGDFLVYGGVHVPGNAAGALSERIEALRIEAGLAADDRLKFNPRPDGLSHERFRDLKQSVIEAAIEHGCRLLA